MGGFVAESAGWLTGSREVACAGRLLGVTRRGFVFRFREPTHRTEREVKAHVA